MLLPSSFDALGEQILQILLSDCAKRSGRADRWPIYHRLQELKIECYCLTDGSLRLQVKNLLEAMLVYSTLMQFFASRQELVDWLEHCWHNQ